MSVSPAGPSPGDIFSVSPLRLSFNPSLKLIKMTQILNIFIVHCYDFQLLCLTLADDDDAEIGVYVYLNPYIYTSTICMYI